MPIYEYTCKSCQKTFDHLAKSMADNEAKVRCPECGSPQTRRALSVFAVASEQGRPSSAMPSGPGMCGRCGGPGPCGME
jgi:putative FmdB family regulatory protein